MQDLQQSVEAVAELHATNHIRLFTALQDLLALFDRKDTQWTVDETLRLKEIRQMVREAKG